MFMETKHSLDARFAPRQDAREPAAKSIARFARISFCDLGYVLDEPISGRIAKEYAKKVPPEKLQKLELEASCTARQFARASEEMLRARKSAVSRSIEGAVVTALFASAFLVAPMAYLVAVFTGGSAPGGMLAATLASAAFLAAMIIRGATDGRKKFMEDLAGRADALMRKAERHCGQQDDG